MMPYNDYEAEPQPATFDEVLQRAEALLEKQLDERRRRMRQQATQDYRFEQKLLQGSFGDRAAQLVLQLRENFVLFQGNIERFQQMFELNFRSFFSLVDYTFEIVEIGAAKDELLPLRQSLRTAKNGRFCVPRDSHILLYLCAQSKLRAMLEAFFKKLYQALTSAVPNFQKLAVQPLAGLAAIKGFAQPVISLLVSKLGDDNVNGAISKVLHEIYQEKAEAQVIIYIFQEFQRQSVAHAKDYSTHAERALRQCVIFMGFNIKAETQNLCYEAARIIINFLLTELEVSAKHSRESQLVYYSLITLTKLSKISDLRRVKDFDKTIQKFTGLGYSVPFAMKVLITNFLVQMLYSFSLRTDADEIDSEAPRASSTKLLGSVLSMLAQLILDLDFQHVNNKFYYLQNSVFKLHRLTVGGLYSNSKVLMALWRKMLHVGLAVTCQENIQEIMQNYVESIKANSQMRSQNLNYKTTSCIFNVSEPSYTQFTLRAPMDRCGYEAPAFELLLMKRSVNPSCRLFATQLLQNHLPSVAKQEKEELSPYGLKAIRAVVKGDGQYHFGKGDELNYVRLAQLKRVMSNRTPRKKNQLTDDEIALAAIRERQRQEEGGVVEEGFEPEEQWEEGEERWEEAKEPEPAEPYENVIRLEKKMKW